MTPSKIFPDRQFPSNDQLLNLFKKADEFKTAAPWKVLQDSDLFGIVDPISNRTCYCSVMGNADLLYGLYIYFGGNGLQSYNLANKNHPHHEDIVRVWDGMNLSFSNRDEVKGSDLKLLKNLNLKYRGRNAYPIFHRNFPCYAPYLLSTDEVKLMEICIDQTLYIADMLNKIPNYIEHSRTGEFLVRVKQNNVWIDEYRLPEEPSRKVAIPIKVDAITLRMIMEKDSSKGEFELDVGLLNNAIHETDPPFFPFLYLCIDAKSSLVIDVDIIKPDSNIEEKACNRLIDFLKKQNLKPRTIRIRNKIMEAVLSEFCKTVGIKLICQNVLPSIKEARELISERMNMG